MSKDVIENKKKQQKAEDFIGWRSPDGKLEVIGIIGKHGILGVINVSRLLFIEKVNIVVKL